MSEELRERVAVTVAVGLAITAGWALGAATYGAAPAWAYRVGGMTAGFVAMWILSTILERRWQAMA